MSVNRDGFTEITPADDGFPSDRLDAFVDRLRSVRRRVARWAPSAQSLAVWGLDYSEVFRAAIRLDLAVQALDGRISERGFVMNDALALEAWAACPPRDVQHLLKDVEACAIEFETTIAANSAASC